MEVASVFFLTTLLLGISQILRIRLLNVLVTPHFSVGLRSGILMNSVCGFLNITTPFRFGDVYRFFFLTKRYQARKSIVLNAIAIERFFDTSILIAFIYVYIGIDSYKSISAQIGFILLCIVTYFLICVANNRRFRSKEQLLWYGQFIHLVKKRKIIIIGSVLGIWTSYLCSGLLIVKFFSIRATDWLMWNLSSFRLLNYTTGNFQLTQVFNIVFIFSFLILGIIMSLLGHRSNRYIDYLTQSKSDSMSIYRLKAFRRSNVSRRMFLEAPLESYWRRENKSGLIGKIHEGGSGALVYSPNTNPLTIRKVGFGHQKHRVKGQFDYILNHTEKWRFPAVRNGTLGRDYFSYDMENIQPSVSMYEIISQTENYNVIETSTREIFKYIILGNKPMGRLEHSEYQRQQHYFWGYKLESIIHNLKLQMPEYFIHSVLDINGKTYDNLEILFLKLKRLAFVSQAQYEISNPHGDPTLSNLLLESKNKRLRGLDPNPNQVIQNISIDHGKVLQSLMAQYEDLLKYKDDIDTDYGYINYKIIMNDSITRSKDLYLEMLIDDLEMLRISELMCFASMLRMLPYRIDQQLETAPVFLAKTIEIASIIEEKYR